MNCCVAVGEGSDDILREPCSFPCDFERDSEGGVVLVVYRMYAGEVFRCEATVNVLTNVFCCKAVCLKLIYMIYYFVYKYFMVVYFHYV